MLLILKGKRSDLQACLVMRELAIVLELVKIFCREQPKRLLMQTRTCCYTQGKRLNIFYYKK